MRLCLLTFGLCCLPACAIEPRDVTVDEPSAPDSGVDSGSAAPDDRDGDGLCDLTEDEFATSSDKLDTDDDGYPDLVEVLNAFDPVDAQSPGQDQVGFLVADRNASYDFETRLTVEGQGEGYTGVFAAYQSLNENMLSAEDFLASAMAVSAEPSENVRQIEASAERFAWVLGRTRLSFRLRFEYTRAPDEFDCAESFSFSYGVKNELGERSGVRDYMLVVTPPATQGLEPESFCLPDTCL